MEIIKYPTRDQWPEILKRPVFDYTVLFEQTGKILENVRINGDKALLKYNLEFDHLETHGLEVTQEEMIDAQKLVSAGLKQAIELARRNIWKFHSEQQCKNEEMQISPGVYCWQKAVPIERIGIYVQGGSAPLFSAVLMLGIPAQIAECKEVILCTTPCKDGTIHPAILYAAKVAGIDRVFKVGGAQSIAAMAYGTETIPKVNKIFGRGDKYVTAAKQLISLSDVAIDMPAGPSELEVLADETANPAFVASDLLSQAEYGDNSQVIMITTSESLIGNVSEQIEIQLDRFQGKETVRKTLEHGKIILLNNIDEAIAITNEYAPEHLIIAAKGYMFVAENIVNAGTVFLGNFSPGSAVDYVSGTNLTLPANGLAKAYSGVSLDNYIKKITFQRLSAEGLNNISNAIIIMAQNEGLQGRANAVMQRLDETDTIDNDNYRDVRLPGRK